MPSFAIGRSIRIVSLLLAVPGLASGELWSPAQREIIDLVAACSDGWVASIQQKDFAIFARACPETSDAVYRYTSGEAPRPYGGPDGSWRDSSANLKRVSWDNLRPMTVQVDGDLALIFYSVVRIPEPLTGASARNPSRRLTVFRRQNGKWLMAGGSIAGVR